MMPDTELSIVGECIAQVSPVVGGTGEGYGLVLRLSTDDGVYAVSELACIGVEVYAAKVIMEGVELQTVLGDRACSTEIKRAPVG